MNKTLRNLFMLVVIAVANVGVASAGIMDFFKNKEVKVTMSGAEKAKPAAKASKATKTKKAKKSKKPKKAKKAKKKKAAKGTFQSWTRSKKKNKSS